MVAQCFCNAEVEGSSPFAGTTMYEVKKINKRLHIVSGGLSVYSPPDFIKIHNRSELIALAEEMNKGEKSLIKYIIEFETKKRP